MGFGAGFRRERERVRDFGQEIERSLGHYLVALRGWMFNGTLSNMEFNTLAFFY